jgi:hypothetical protein
MSFSVGNVLGKSFGIWFRNLIPFALLSAAVHVPLLVYVYFVMSGLEQSADLERTFLIYSIVSFVLSMALGYVASGAIIYGVVAEMRGAHASFGDCVGVGIRRLLPVIGVGILMTLCIMGGFILLIVPGVIITCMLFVSVAAAVCERPGLFGALRRSRELTRGYKLQIFGMMFVLGLLGWAVGAITQKVWTPQTLDDVKLHAYVAIGFDVVLGALNAVVAAVTYALLRQEKEGTDTDELARVFT